MVGRTEVLLSSHQPITFAVTVVRTVTMTIARVHVPRLFGVSPTRTSVDDTHVFVSFHQSAERGFLMVVFHKYNQLSSTRMFRERCASALQTQIGNFVTVMQSLTRTASCFRWS